MQIHNDILTRAMFATDASMYQLMPQSVCYPKSFQDCKDILKYCQENQLSITCRGAGTSLAGQATGTGVIIDFSKYMTSVLEIDEHSKLAKVLPGVTRDFLNEKLEPHNLHFAPDPATSSRATIGGMIANNSSGTKSILYGKTIDHLHSLKVLLFDGSVIECKSMTPQEVEQKCQLKNTEGELYRLLWDIQTNHREDVVPQYPKVMRRVNGYALDAIIGQDNWNLSSLFCGSEGTLGIILEATIRLTPLPAAKKLLVLHYSDRKSAIDDVAKIVQTNPAAVEMCDSFVLEQCKDNIQTKHLFDDYILPQTDTILIVEYYGESIPMINTQVSQLQKILNGSSQLIEIAQYIDNAEMKAIWQIRKKGLGLLMGKKTKAKPIAFIEDCAIPLEHLSNYIGKIEEKCQELDIPVVVYAHASVGVLHVRPILDLTDAEDVESMKILSNYSYSLVKKFGGAWSGEHGDGRARSYQLKDYFGDLVYSFFIKIKHTLDPHQIFNPNIIVDSQAMDQHLRFGPQYQVDNQSFEFLYKKDQSFASIVHNCSGIGACVQKNGGLMCPSYMATHEEKDSTRGRANIIRMAMSGQIESQDLTSSVVQDALQNCLSCKACKSECPSNVDVAKLKAEILQKVYDKNGIPRHVKLASNLRQIASLGSGHKAYFVNKLMRNPFVKTIQEKHFKLDKRRTFPTISNHPFAHKSQSQKHNKTVGLFGDCYSKYFDSDIGRSVVKLLEKLEYNVEFLDKGCCQRPALSNGLLKSAKKESRPVVEQIKSFSHDIIVTEPSCLSALDSDLPDLIESFEPKGNLFSLAEFLLKEKINIASKVQSDRLVIHGHCHEKSLRGSESIKLVLQNFGYDVELLNTGCCGMAGTFGMMAETYDVSKKVAETSLLPYLLEHPEAKVVATGFSCRHQIADFAHRESKHWVEYVVNAL